MLGKMLIHGLVAAALTASAAAVFAQAKDNGYLPPQTPQTTVAAPVAAAGADGYLRPAAAELRRHKDDHRHDRKHERRRDGRDRDHDDDDD